MIGERGDLLAVLPDDMEAFMNLSWEQQLCNLLIANPMHSCTIVCRRDALQSIGGFKQPEGLPYVDGSTWLELSLIGNFLPINAVLGCYRRHDNQISSAMKSSMIRAGLYSVEFLKISLQMSGLLCSMRTLISLPGWTGRQRRSITIWGGPT